MPVFVFDFGCGTASWLAALIRAKIGQNRPYTPLSAGDRGRRSFDCVAPQAHPRRNCAQDDKKREAADNGV